MVNRGHCMMSANKTMLTEESAQEHVEQVVQPGMPRLGAPEVQVQVHWHRYGT